MYLLDTNVISEYRKATKANAGIIQFFDATQDEALFLPVQVIGEIQAGISKLRRQKDAQATRRANTYELWLDSLLAEFGDRILQFDIDAARLWGTLLSSEKKDPHSIDKQIAAIALIHSLTVVTRDKGIAFTRIPNLRTFDPFTST